MAGAKEVRTSVPGQGKGDEKIRDRQEQSTWGFQPSHCRVILALGTMPIFAGRIAVLEFPARDARVDMPTEDCSPAVSNGLHGVHVAGEQAVLVLRPVCRSRAPEDLRQLDHGSPSEVLRGLP